MRTARPNRSTGIRPSAIIRRICRSLRRSCLASSPTVRSCSGTGLVSGGMAWICWSYLPIAFIADPRAAPEPRDIRERRSAREFARVGAEPNATSFDQLPYQIESRLDRCSLVRFGASEPGGPNRLCDHTVRRVALLEVRAWRAEIGPPRLGRRIHNHSRSLEGFENSAQDIFGRRRIRAAACSRPPVSRPIASRTTSHMVTNRPPGVGVGASPRSR